MPSTSVLELHQTVTFWNLSAARESARSNPWRCSVRKRLLRNFAKFTEKHLCQGLFFNKRFFSLFLKQRFWHRCFPGNFAKFLRTPFLQNTSGRLHLIYSEAVARSYSPKNVLLKCSQIHRKPLVPKSCACNFSKKRLQDRCFPVNMVKLSMALFSGTSANDLFCQFGKPFFSRFY